MRAVVQKTLTSSVTSDGVLVGKAAEGLTVLLGVSVEDDEKDALYLADKIVHLRIFEDEAGKLNDSLLDKGAFGVETATGRFRTHMVVSLENDGPVTILLDSKKTF